MASQIPQVASAPTLGQFLVAINGFMQHQNDDQLANWIQLEPPFNAQYMQMAAELRQAYPKGSADDNLREKCTQALVVARDGLEGSPSWTQFVLFMVQYLSYLRDVDADPTKYLETYELLYDLQQKANSALTHPSLGHMMVPTVVSCAQLICRLAIGLDRQPELIAHLRGANATQKGGDDGPKDTLPERAAELIRKALVTCLNDRFSGLGKDGRPEGKKRGIYKIANICLKIFFQCRKTRNASQIFTNIGNLSPPLAAYPKRERVTYLYYLGRFWFQNNHFYRALLALQYAYDECSARPEFVRQRRYILIYLITCSLIMGRFPSASLLQRPEAHGLHERFAPIMQSIRTGNLALFRQHLAFHSPHADWFLHFRILLQLANRCEVLVWRSLIRKTCLLHGTNPGLDSKLGPTLDMNALLTTFSSQSLEGEEETAYTNPDFDSSSSSSSSPITDTLTLTTIESLLSSLIEQSLIRGFIMHTKQNFVISGVKAAGGDVLAAGFPPAWPILKARGEGKSDVRMADVPGWNQGAVVGATTGMSAGGGGGMVVNLSGARAVGVS